MDATPEPAERARSGIRSWVRSAGSGLRRATPYGIVAFLAASAVAPVAGAALGATAEYSAALGQLGGMGSNYLADALTSAAARIRGDGRDDAWRDAVAEELLARLDAGDAALRDEIAGLLHAVGGVEAALRAADEQTRSVIVDAFDDLQELARDTRQVLDDIRRELAGQAAEQRTRHEALLRALAAATLQRRSVRDPGTPAPPAPADVAPYPGLASFDLADARFFHGRENAVTDLLGRLTDHALGGPPLVVVGVSGVGKSSLLRAGLLPAIADDGLGEGSGRWPILVMTPGATPLATLRDGLTAFAGAERLVILVDQFEELFTQGTDPAGRAAFVTALAAVPRALLILSIRADFYPQCTELPPLRPLLAAGQVVVGPLTGDDLRRAITEPARDASLTVEPGLVEVLLRDYRPGALPLLAHALRATWERRAGDTLTVAGYERTGGIRRAVADTAEDIYAELDDTGRAALRSALLGLVTLVDGGAVRHRASRAETDMTVLRPLIDARLVTTGTDTVEISHEALLDGWPRLAGWLVEAREEILLRQRLGQAAQDWAEAGEDPDALYRGARLAAAREWAAGRTDLPEVQRRFLAASVSATDAELEAQRRTTSRLRRLVAGLAVALLLVVAGGLVSLDQRAAARDNEQVALSRQHAAQSEVNYRRDQHRAVRAALLAWQAAPTREARNALMYAQQTGLVGQLGSRAENEAFVAVNAGATLAAVGYPGGAIDIWDITTLSRSGRPLRYPGGALFSLGFSPDGRFLAAGGEGEVVLWDMATGSQLRTLPAIGGATWAPGTGVLVSGRAGDPSPGIGFWDAATGRLLETVENTVRIGVSLAVSPDGRYLAVALDKDHGEIVRRSDGRPVASIAGATDVAFDAKGTLYSSGIDQPVQARRPGDGWKPVILHDPADRLQGGVSSFHGLSPDGTVFIGGDVQGETLQLSLGGRMPVLDGFGGYVWDAGVSADGRVLVVAGPLQPPTVIRLDASLRHPQIVSGLAFDPTGPRLATASADPVIRIWDTRTRALAATLPVDADDGALGLAYGPDGSLAAAFSQGSRVLVYGPDRKLRRTLSFDPRFYPGTVAFSPDGALLTVDVTARDSLEEGVDGSTRAQQRDDPDVFVWDARTLAPRPPVEVAGRLPFHHTFTPDGRYLLVAANRIENEGEPGQRQTGVVSRFRLPDLTPVDEREVPGAIGEIAVSPDSATVAVPLGRHVELLRVDGLLPAGQIGEHPQQLTRAAWSPDGRTLATGADNDLDVVRLWDTVTREPIGELRGNSSQEGQIAFSPDGATLAAGSNDWTVALWQVDPEDAVQRLCAMLAPSAGVAGEPLPASCS